MERHEEHRERKIVRLSRRCDGRTCLGLLAGVWALLATIPAVAQDTPPVPPDIPQAIRERLKTLVVEELNRRLATADQWDVNARGTLEDLTAGRLPDVEIRGENVRLPDGEAIAEVALTITNARVDYAHSTLLAAGTASLVLRLPPEDMARAIDAWAGKRLERVRLRIRRSHFVMHAKIRVLGLGLRFARRSSPQLQDNAVYARSHHISVAGLAVPISLMRKLERRINPVIDPGEMQVPVTIDAIGAEDGFFTVRLHADLAGQVRDPEEAVLRRIRRRQRRLGRE